MSSSLHWRTPNPQGTNFGYELKFPLREYLHDGFIGEWTYLGMDAVSFLEGVIAGAGKDSSVAREAAALIGLIGKHGGVEIREVS